MGRTNNGELRRWRIAEVREGRRHLYITIGCYPQAHEVGFLDDIWDADGDSIRAVSRVEFCYDAPPPIEVRFLQGQDPSSIVRVLKKSVRMLEGPKRFKIANLALSGEGLDTATRMEDGSVIVYDFNKLTRAELKRMGWSLDENKGQNDD